MSVSFVERCSDLVIPNGATTSNILGADYDYGDAAALSFGSITLSAGTLSFQVSIDGGTTWLNYQEGSPLADLPFPATNKAITSIGIVAFPQIRILISVASVGATTVQVSRHFTVGAGLG